MTPTTLIPDGSTVWVSGDRLRPVHTLHTDRRWYWRRDSAATAHLYHPV